MTRQRLLVWPALALASGAVAWALTGLPGSPAACLPADCDCETPGPGPIRQPANAWSSLALTLTGVLLLIASPGRRPGEARGSQARAEGKDTGELVRALSPSPQPPPGRGGREGEALPPGRLLETTRTIAAGALVAAGVGAFLYHAGLTAWAARLDGITVAVLSAAAALHAAARTAETLRHPDRLRKVPWRLLATSLLLALGAACWWLGQSGGACCRPDSPWQAHAAWHLLAAAAVGLWLGPGRSSPQPPAASSLRGRRATHA